jgi:diacylglycerol kinase family enzyme
MRLNLAWRMVAFLELLVYAVLVFLAILLFAHNLILAVVFGATSIILVYAAWLLFTGAGKRQKAGLWLIGIVLLVLAAELIIFLSDKKNRRALIAVLALSVTYLLLIAILRQKYWSLKRINGELGSKTAHFKNPYLIINPKSGNGRAIKAHIGELAKKQGISVLMTQKGGSVEDIAREAADAGADVLGISGGDGSIGAVAKVAIERNLPMVVLPGGTRCHFARDLGLDPKRITDSLASFTGIERRIDAAKINNRIFLNNASFGLYADIVDQPHYREHKLEASRRVLGSIVQGSKKLYDLQFARGKLHFKNAAQVLVGINRYNTMNLFELGHRERLDEGVLQVTALTQLDNNSARQLLKSVSIDQLTKQSKPEFYQWVDNSFTVESKNEKIVVGVDGEREEFKTPVNIRVIPGALRIFVPAEGERNRQKNPFSKAVVGRMWHAAANKI